MKILIIEDDRSTAEMIRNGLASEDHVVEIAEDGASGAIMGRSFDYDAIILDYSLPKKNGLTVCHEIRSSGKSTPIIFVSINDDPEIKIGAFENGADDYVIKPFVFRELQARLHAISRRPNLTKKQLLKIGDLVLDIDKHTLTRAGKRIHTTRKEFSLLEYFMKNAGTILSRALLMEHVWTADSNPFSNTVEAHIGNLRRKLNAGKKPNLIINVPGRGYVMDTPQNLKKI